MHYCARQNSQNFVSPSRVYVRVILIEQMTQVLSHYIISSKIYLLPNAFLRMLHRVM